MNLIDNYIDLIDIVASILCVIFSFIFISKTTKKNSSILYLGFYLLVNSSESFRAVLNLIPSLKNNPNLDLIPISLLLLRHPLLLLYLQKLSYLNKKTIRKPLLFFVGFEILLFLIFFATDRLDFILSKEALIYMIGNVYMLFFSIYILFWIKNHLKIYESKYNLHLKKQIQWVGNYVIADMLLGFLVLIFPFIYSSYWLDTAFWAYYLGLNFWIIYRGFYHIGMFDFSSIKLESSKSKAPIENSELLDDFHKINDYLTDSNTFKNPELSIQNVSSDLNITPQKVSKAINMVSTKNFSSFVNSIRIEYAKKLLTDTNFEYLSVEGIAKETGFKSRSAFYIAFKKNTNVTPAQYKKEHSPL